MLPNTEAWQNVVDNPALSRFELSVDGLTAFLTYARAAGAIRMLHTEVPEAFRGRGIGASLVKGALELSRASGLRVVPLCPFVRTYLEKHPESPSTT